MATYGDFESSTYGDFGGGDSPYGRFGSHVPGRVRRRKRPRKRLPARIPARIVLRSDVWAHVTGETGAELPTAAAPSAETAGLDAVHVSAEVRGHIETSGQTPAWLPTVTDTHTHAAATQTVATTVERVQTAADEADLIDDLIVLMEGQP